MAKQLRFSKSTLTDNRSNQGPEFRTSQHCEGSYNSDIQMKSLGNESKRSRSFSSLSPHLTYKCGHKIPDCASSHTHRSQHHSGEGLYTIQQQDQERQVTKHCHPHCKRSAAGIGSRCSDLEQSSSRKSMNRLECPHSQQNRMVDCPHGQPLRHSHHCSPVMRRTNRLEESEVIAMNLDADIRSIVATPKRTRTRREETQDEVLPGPVPPPPPPPPQQTQTPQQQNKTASAVASAHKRRAKAIAIDRFSRVFFPLTFGMMNLIYWVVFWIYL